MTFLSSRIINRKRVLKTLPDINFNESDRRREYTLALGSHKIRLGRKTCIMGIINLTPDSFSGDGCYTGKTSSVRQALKLADQMVKEGADILDVGGESSRPGAKPVSVKEELARILPVIKALAKSNILPVSVDTYKPAVACAALDAGASMINDIKGATPDKQLTKMVVNYKAAIVLMHMRQAPLTMQKNIKYKNLIENIRMVLKHSMATCLTAGIPEEKIIIDPGIGFGKTLEHNLEIIRFLKAFACLDRPLLIGTSRKSFIGLLLNQPVQERLIGSIASVCAGTLYGAHIVRVHDIRQTREALRITDAVLN